MLSSNTTMLETTYCPTESAVITGHCPAQMRARRNYTVQFFLLEATIARM